MRTIMAVMLITGLIFAGMFVPTVSALDGTPGTDRPQIKPDQLIPPDQDSTPKPIDNTLQPACLLDSSLFDGQDPQPAKPDEPTFGSFDCRT
jgi:hypothetical protein